MISMEHMAPLMFASLIVVMLIGFPVAFSLAGLGLGFGYFAISQGFFSEAWSDAAWPKTCWKAQASSLAANLVAWALP
jgi:TRAP-type mannitol/chloroaromatic compound transport system permease large subunit